MNDNFEFNDTFDNFTFSNSSKDAKRYETIRVSDHGTIFLPEDEKETEIGIVSFDDSAFLSESFSVIRTGTKSKQPSDVSNGNGDDFVHGNIYNLVERENRNGGDRKPGGNEAVSNFITISDKKCDKNNDLSNNLLYDISNCSSFNVTDHLLCNYEKQDVLENEPIILNNYPENVQNKSDNGFKISNKTNQVVNIETDLFNNSDDILDCSNELIGENILNYLCSTKKNNREDLSIINRRIKKKVTSNCNAASIFNHDHSEIAKTSEPFDYNDKTDESCYKRMRGFESNVFNRSDDNNSDLFKNFNTFEFINDSDEVSNHNFIKNNKGASEGIKLNVLNSVNGICRRIKNAEIIRNNLMITVDNKINETNIIKSNNTKDEIKTVEDFDVPFVFSSEAGVGNEITTFHSITANNSTVSENLIVNNTNSCDKGKAILERNGGEPEITVDQQLSSSYSAEKSIKDVNGICRRTKNTEIVQNKNFDNEINKLESNNRENKTERAGDFDSLIASSGESGDEYEVCAFNFEAGNNLGSITIKNISEVPENLVVNNNGCDKGKAILARNREKPEIIVDEQLKSSVAIGNQKNDLKPTSNCLTDIEENEKEESNLGISMDDSIIFSEDYFTSIESKENPEKKTKSLNPKNLENFEISIKTIKNDKQSSLEDPSNNIKKHLTKTKDKIVMEQSLIRSTSTCLKKNADDINIQDQELKRNGLKFVSSYETPTNKINTDENIITTVENQEMSSADEAPTKNPENSKAIQSSRSQSTELSCELSDWNLPEMILQKYAKNKVTKMFEWQLRCLNDQEILSNNRNLVYSAPTSAGKTLVAEILAVKTLIERSKKVIFVLPFVSVVREKTFHFQDLLSTSGVRADGFMGSYHPPGGFKTVQLAVCTIEKANSLINRLLEEGQLGDVGAVIIDEIHLLGDPSRGYLLELLLTKLKYMIEKDKEANDIQIIGMSATLPNLELLAKWLDAKLFTTDFRPIPLFEQCHVHGEIYDNNLTLVRKLPVLKELETDTDNILQLCLETIRSSCSVLIFCPTKNWCENLSQQTATAFWKLGNSKSELGQCLRSELNPQLIAELLEQLKRCPVGLDKVLSKTISFAVAFHHAGLTMDERDIIEGGFRSGAVRVLVATSTLSSGVNLPARRVIIRTPNFYGKSLCTLTYRQMIGRAGRMGKDTAGESLLICQQKDYKIAKELMSAKLEPVESCLQSGRLKRAILEVVASGVASTLEDVNLFANCTLLSNQENDGELQNPIEEAIDFLQRNEFVRLQTLEDGTLKYIATPLGKACLSSSLPPEEGLALFTELEKARQCFVLETELHLIYLVTPYNCCNQWGNNLDWMFYLSLWEKLPASMKRVGELVGVRESYMVNALRGKIQTNTSASYQKLQIHKRFYTALALQDLVNEVSLNVVASKFNCSRGLLQSLQQSAATFAGMVTSFSKQLGWTSVELLISQFQDRLHFGINRDLLDLMRLPVMNGPRARTLYDAGIQTLSALATSSADAVENILHRVAPFESEKEREGETKYDAERRNKVRAVWVTGRQGLTEREAAEMLIGDARKYIQLEMGLVEVKWGSSDVNSVTITEETTCLAGNDNTVIGMRKSKKNILYKKEVINPLDKYKGVKIGPVKPNDQRGTLNSEVNITKPENEMVPKCSREECTIIPYEKGADCNKNLSGKVRNCEHVEVQPLETVKLESSESHQMKVNTSLNTKVEMPQNKSSDTEESINTNRINVQNSTPKIKSDTNSTFSFSDTSLFESSFNMDTINLIERDPKDKNEYPQPANIGSPEIDNLDLKLSLNTSEVVTNVSNTSNECIGSSQNYQSSTNTSLKFVYDKTMSRKRKQFKHESSSDSSGTYTVKTPSKKKRVARKPKAKSSEKINPTFVTDRDKPFTTLTVQGPDLSSTDLSRLDIVNISDHEDVFKSFCSEIRTRREISLSVGCVETRLSRPKIGIKTSKANDQNSGFWHANKEVKGISVGWGGSTAYYLSFESSRILHENKVSIIREVLANPGVKVRMFDGKENIKAINLCLNVDFKAAIEDPKIADWILDPDGREKNLQAMAMKYAPETVNLLQLAGVTKGVGSIGLNVSSSATPKLRSAVESVVTWHLVQAVLEVISQLDMKLLHAYYIEMSLIHILTRMELNGLGVSLLRLEQLSNTLVQQNLALERKAFKIAGRTFSMTSSNDVAKILGMHQAKKRVSTNKQVLEKNLDNPIVPLIVQWRKINSILTRTIYPLLRLVKSDRIYGTCTLQNPTGRISMHEPNLQNVPRNFEADGDEDNKTILISCRDAFQAKNKFTLVSADYCQLELRLLAHFSKDRSLIKVLQDTNRDVFKGIAAKLNNVHLDEVTDEMRQNAKQICYGIIYGMGVRGLADQMNASEEEATLFLEVFHEKYPTVQKFIRELIENCKEDGFVNTLGGRRRYLPNINDHHHTVKSQAERQAVNTTIQGSAADIAKSALVLVNGTLSEKFRSSRNKPELVLQLHDEFLYEVPEKYSDAVAKIIKKCMENSIQLSVPFPVKVRIGKTWGSLEEKSF